MHIQHEEYSPAAVDLMSAIERGTLTMQEIAEAFAALSDDELEDLEQLLRKRHGAPMMPRSD
jgi:hypothetical protein